MNSGKENLEEAVDKLGEELVGIMPGVFGSHLRAGSKARPELILVVICIEEAKMQILKKYGDTYRGHKLHFRKGGGTIVFAHTD